MCCSDAEVPTRSCFEFALDHRRGLCRCNHCFYPQPSTHSKASGICSPADCRAPAVRPCCSTSWISDGDTCSSARHECAAQTWADSGGIVCINRSGAGSHSMGGGSAPRRWMIQNSPIVAFEISAIPAEHRLYHRIAMARRCPSKRNGMLASQVGELNTKTSPGKTSTMTAARCSAGLRSCNAGAGKND